MLPNVKEEVVAVIVSLLYRQRSSLPGSPLTPIRGKGVGFCDSPTGRHHNNERERRSRQLSWRELNLDALESIGGIDTIIRIYIRDRSMRSLRNLFTVIFDYAVATYDEVARERERSGSTGRGVDGFRSHIRRRSTPVQSASSTSGSVNESFGTLSGRSAKPNKPIDDKQVAFIFELFIALKAPEAFTDLFRYVPDKFVEGFVKYVFFFQMEKVGE